ncbi:MAG: hypothetical protein AAFO79_09185 [Pseudomonadota bacterium]
MSLVEMRALWRIAASFTAKVAPNGRAAFGVYFQDHGSANVRARPWR